MKAILAVLMLFSSVSFASQNREFLECYNKKASIYVWFCRLDGQLTSDGCEAPNVKFVAPMNDEGVSPKVAVQIKGATLTVNDKLTLEIQFSKSEKEPNKLLKVLTITSADFVRENDFNQKTYTGKGTLTLPKSVVKNLKKNKVDFDTTEDYTCTYESR